MPLSAIDALLFCAAPVSAGSQRTSGARFWVAGPGKPAQLRTMPVRMLGDIGLTRADVYGRSHQTFLDAHDRAADPIGGPLIPGVGLAHQQI